MKRSYDSDGSDNEIFQYSNKIKLSFKQCDVEVMNSSSSDSSSSSSADQNSDSEVELDDSKTITPKNNSENKKSDLKKKWLENEFLSPSPSVVAPVAKAKNLAALKMLDQLNGMSPLTPNTSTEDIHDEDDSDIFISLKIRIHGIIKKFNIGKNQKFQTIHEDIAENNKVKASNVSLTLTRNNYNILPSDTVHRLKITIADIIDCVIVQEDNAADEPKIILQLQSRSDRQKQKFVINTTAVLNQLIIDYARENRLDKDKIYLSLDGDKIDPSKTPSSLDLEDDDVLDVVVES